MQASCRHGQADTTLRQHRHHFRVGTFADFSALAEKNKLHVLDAFGLQDGQEVRWLPNLMAGTAVFKFER